MYHPYRRPVPHVHASELLQKVPPLNGMAEVDAWIESHKDPTIDHHPAVEDMLFYAPHFQTMEELDAWIASCKSGKSRYPGELTEEEFQADRAEFGIGSGRRSA